MYSYNLNYDLKKYKVLPQEENMKLAHDYENGEAEAREKLILHNLRLAISYAQKIAGSKGEILEELVSVSILGLIKGVDSFNPNMNIKFATYVSTCIQNEIFMYLRKNKKHDQVASLNEPIISRDRDISDLTLEEMVQDSNGLIEDKVEADVEKTVIREIIDSLPPLEKEIVKKYYGFDSDRRYKQDEIANIFGYTQSYTSRILKRTNEKIKVKYLKRMT